MYLISYGWQLKLNSVILSACVINKILVLSKAEMTYISVTNLYLYSIEFTTA